MRGSRTTWHLAVSVVSIATFVLMQGGQPTVRAPEGRSAAETSAHHGQLLLAQVGDLTSHARALRRIEAAAAKRDPSGRAGSGGRVVVHRAGGGRIGPGSAHALLHRTGAPGAEPTIGVLPDGSVLIQALASKGVVRSVVLRTRDGGRTFVDVTPRTNGEQTHALTLDPYLYVEPRTGRIFTTDFVGCGLVSSSDDGGERWATSPPLCSELADHQTVFGGPPVSSTTKGYPELVYYCAASLVAVNRGSTSTACEKSTDGGNTFVPTGRPAFAPQPRYDDEGTVAGICTGLVGHGAVGPDGSVYLPKTCERPLLAVSRDEGSTWLTIAIPTSLGVNTDAVGEPDHEAAVAVDARGVIYYSWMSRTRLPYLTTSRDGGRTWSPALMVGAPGINEAVLPGLAVTPGGRVAISYMGTKNSPGHPFPNDSCPGLNCPRANRYTNTTWNGYITVSDNPLSADPTFSSVSINDEADPLVVGQCGPFRCQQQADFNDVQFGPDGTPWAAFVDGCDPKLRCESRGEAVVGRIVGLPRHR